MDADFKKIVGKKILGVSNGYIYLEDDICINYHPYETYVEHYDMRRISPKNVDYYSPRLFGKIDLDDVENFFK
jgi:hypothetical protein